VVVMPSPSSYAETSRRLIDAIEQRSLTVFARIDHADGARAAGLELPDEEVVVFGNPQAGTPLMQSDPRVGIELPLRVLIWADADGTKLGFNDPRTLASEYDVGEHAETLAKMAGLLAAVIADAVGQA
jgi:uncharacterized protein (DUF302 family)